MGLVLINGNTKIVIFVILLKIRNYVTHISMHCVSDYIHSKI